MDFQWFYKGKSLKPYCNFIKNQWIWRIIFGNITSIENTFQNRILQNPSRISYPFSKTLSLPNLTLWEVVSSLQLAQFRTADPEHFCHQTLCFQTHPTEVHHVRFVNFITGFLRFVSPMFQYDEKIYSQVQEKIKFNDGDQ